MPELLSLSRPYAKAIFHYALTNNQLDNWSLLLNCLDFVVNKNNVVDFIANPASTIAQHNELLLAATKKYANNIEKALTNFIKILADNKRLLMLPSINTLFVSMRANYEQTLLVKVVSFSLFTDAQKQLLIKKLTQRFLRKIELNITIDPSLIGGAIIYADNLVIDGSVLGKLNKLKIALKDK